MKRLFSYAAALACAALLLTGSALAAVAPGRYLAEECAQDGTQYVCEGEYILLNEDGTGEMSFNNVELQVTWEESEDGAVRIRDDHDGVFEGTYTPGEGLRGTYRKYEYFYRQETPAADPAAAPATAAVPAGTYIAAECVKDGTGYVCDGDYFTLNEDGTGVVCFNGTVYTLTWQAENAGDTVHLAATDEREMMLEGTYDPEDGVSATYRGYHYLFVPGEVPALRTAENIAPERWGKGLPLVFDQAGILTESEVQALTEQAQEISQSYPCDVHIITVDDYSNYVNGTIEKCAEDIRTGYDLGRGDDRDCIVLLLSMRNRKYDIVIHGAYAHEIFPAENREAVARKFLDNFKEDDWYGGFRDYLTRCGKYLSGGGKLPVSLIGAIIGALIPAAPAALIFCAAKKHAMQAVAEQTRAGNYVAKDGCKFTYRADRYTGTTVTRTYSPRQSSSGGSGGSSSGGGGHSHTSGSF